MKRQYRHDIVAAILFTLGASALWYVNAGDYEQQQRQQSRYCADVETWREEAKQGIAPLDRTGHPDFKEIYATACK